MNIVIVSSMFLPSTGGVERYTDNLSRTLVKLKHRVTVLTGNSFRLPEEEETEPGLRVLRARCLPLLHGRFTVTFPASVKQCFRKILDEPVDFVLIQTRFYPLSAEAARLCKKHGLRFAVLDHGSSHINFNIPAIDWVVRLYEHAVTWLIKRRCSSYYGVSKASCEWLKHFGIEAREPLYNSIDGAGIRELAASEPARIRFRPEEGTVITYTGRLIPQKGVMKLARAVEKLAAAGERVVLFIAGDGPLRGELEALKSPAITYLGQLQWEEVIRLLLRSDLYVLPSDSEGFPTSVLEAAAAGCYVISTAAGGTKEIIPSAEYGTLLPYASSDNLAEAILDCIHAPSSCLEAAENARERVNREFTWERTAEKLLRVIAENYSDR